MKEESYYRERRRGSDCYMSYSSMNEGGELDDFNHGKGKHLTINTDVRSRNTKLSPLGNSDSNVNIGALGHSYSK